MKRLFRVEDHHLVYDTSDYDQVKRWLKAAEELDMCYSLQRLDTTGSVYRSRFPQSDYAKVYEGQSRVVFWVFSLEIGPYS